MTELDLIRSRIRERLNYYADELASGLAKSYDEYRYIVGMIEGLALAERDVLDVQAKLQSDD